MPLPFRPESVASLTARYQAALVPTWDAEAIGHRPNAPRPGQLRAHIFDCENGLRLIISRDRLPDGAVGIHFSASVAPGFALADEIRVGSCTQIDFETETPLMWARLAGRLASDELGDKIRALRGVTFLGLSDGMGVPHWFVLERTAA